MMIKKEENRKRMAYEQVFEITEEMINVDPGMAAVKEYFEGIKLVTEDDEETAKEYFGPIKDVGKSTSTIGLMQKFNEEKVGQLLDQTVCSKTPKLANSSTVY